MNKFNLTFSGEIIEGHDPELVRARVAQVLEIDDPAVVDRHFSGERVVLYRNLDRKEAAELYARLKRMGLHVELVKIGERGDLHAGEKDTRRAQGDDQAKTTAASTVAEKRTTTSVRPPKKVTTPAAPKVPPVDTKTSHEMVSTAEEAKPGATGNGQEKQTQESAKKLLAADRRADLAARKKLKKQEHTLLQAKERALQKALKAKEKEAARRAGAAERTRQKDQARKAKLQAKQEETKRKQEQQRKRKEAAAARQAEYEKARAEAAAERALQAAERAEEERQAEARRLAKEEEQRAHRRVLEEQAISRAASELAQKPALKPVDARVKTRIETPARRRGSGQTGTQRRRQPGAPNLYSLTPFRNTPDIQARAEQSRGIMRRALIGAAMALGLALIVGARIISLPAPPPISGADTLVITPQDGPLMLKGAELLLHDRSGVSEARLSLANLGVSELSSPMAFDTSGRLLAPGRLSGSPATDNATTNPVPPLLRCALAESTCERFPADLENTTVSALVVHAQNSNLFIGDSTNGALLKLSPEGELLARAAMNLPAKPVLRLNSGLLLVNSPLAAAISVFRYEDTAFGQQLDELLLQPPTPNDTTYAGVRDFIWSAGHWWVLMEVAAGGGAHLHRFDEQWQFVDSPALAQGTNAIALVNWGDRVLVTDPSRIPVQRFNSDGMAEVPLASKALDELVQGQVRHAKLVQLGWRIALALSLLAAIIGLCIGSLHRARNQVYRSCRERGAHPIDKFNDTIDWIELAPDRITGLHRTAIAYAALACGVILGAIGMGASSLQLLAALLVLAGPAIGLLLLQRSDPGHIGIHGPELILADHNGLYHLGAGSRIHWCGPFLMIDDVTVFLGAPFLPAFDPTAVRERVRPATAGAVKVDRKIVRVKLLQSRHPLALAAIAIAVTIATAVALLSLQGSF